MLNDKELYELAEQFIACEVDGALDEACMAEFANATQNLSDDEKAAILNLALEINANDDTTQEDTDQAEAAPTVEDAVVTPDQEPA